MANQHQSSTSSFQNYCCDNVQSKRSVVEGEIVVVRSNGQPSGSAKSTCIQIVSATKIDPKTGNGKLSEQTFLECGKTSTIKNGDKITTYRIKFQVEPEFEIPGAILIKNQHKKKRFFLLSATLKTPSNQIVKFDCNSWVYPFKMTKTGRIFFSTTKYLPNQTPEALLGLRKKELRSLRSTRRRERKEWDRTYDYDLYNDLGDPDKGPEYMRPILGGSDLDLDSYPYPRRFRTGRPCSIADPSTERPPSLIDLAMCVPPDERFSSKKMSEFISSSIQAVSHYVIQEVDSLSRGEPNSFKSFDEVHYKFSGNRRQVKMERRVNEMLKKVTPAKLFHEVDDMRKKNPLKFPSPQIVAENEWAWKNDDEFVRQMLAGTNPARIQSLEEFPPKGQNGVVSSIQESDIEHNLDGMTVAEAVYEWRIFILDHHDYLMPFLDRLNRDGVCVCASRTLVFQKSDNTLKPLAIELSLPGFSEDQQIINRVFVPATKGEAGALWQYAKAHVATNDSVYHQLISHWLHTHAVVEPFIIATRRQLSVMHPVHWLLHPHFKDTLHVNALARSILINSGGILEKTLFTAEISMEFSAELYRKWRFDEQALPADLLKRGMATGDEDPDNPTRVKLIVQDYPYGADGLEIWAAIKTWVTDFCTLFYIDDEAVASDEEIQAWWWEIRNVGHGDKRNETWWYKMTTLSDLVEALTTLIWIASALHASVNFGQYDYSGYPLNRPTQCRRFIPWEGTFPYAEFLNDPDDYYLKMLPGKLETSLSVALVAVLSRHASDEVYLGQRSSLVRIKNKQVCQKFEKFRKELRKIEKRITERNANLNLKNRRGPAGIPYQLLYPDTSKFESRGGITGKGIPNSISI